VGSLGHVAIVVGSPGPNLIRSDASRSDFFLQQVAGANDRIDPGGGVDYVYAGQGDDNITATDQVGDTINCGSNPMSPSDSDTVTGDAIDAFFSCENVSVIPCRPVRTGRVRTSLSPRGRQSRAGRSRARGLPRRIASTAAVRNRRLRLVVRVARRTLQAT
jgi:hypothetical protein